MTDLVFHATDLAGLNAAIRAIDIGGSAAAYTIVLNVPTGTLRLDSALLAIARLEDGFRVEAIRRALARRAGCAPANAPPRPLRCNIERRADTVLEGWAFDPADPGTPVELELRDGATVVARGVANRYRTDLDRAELAGGRCAFRIRLPEQAGALALHRARDGARLGMV